jgi:hypothetical protein
MHSREIAPSSCVSSRKPWPRLPEEHAVLLLSRALSYKLDDGTVIVEVPENTTTVSSAEPGVRPTSRSTGEIGQ